MDKNGLDNNISACICRRFTDMNSQKFNYCMFSINNTKIQKTEEMQDATKM